MLIDMKNIFSLLRVNHWTKNFFIFAVTFFHGEIFNFAKLANLSSSFFLFCLISSIVYIFNDIIDRNDDRKNLKFKHRPLASGDIKFKKVIIILTILLFGTMIIIFTGSISQGTLYLIFLYLGINFLYTIYLKKIIYLEIFLISSGFIIRLYVGSFATNIDPSSWIVICTWLLSLFMIIGKRVSEMNLGYSRKVLQHYNYKHLANVLKVVYILIVLTYIFYSIDTIAIKKFKTYILFTIPFVIFGMYYYLKLLTNIKVKLEPTILIFKNKILFITGILWLFVFMLVIYIK
jgi:4-hydroxybenzoate polyprenyltransferase